MERIRVCQIGLGAIGLACAAEARRRPGLELLGGVDIDPGLEGKDLGLLAEGTRWSLPVRRDLESALREWRPRAALLTTVSQVERLAPVLETLIRAGVNVVSSSEELLVPRHRAPEASAALDALARSAGVTVMAAGVNPGFTMDLFPLFLSSMSRRVEKVEVRRCLDAAARRESLQRKVGAGLSLDAFHAGQREGWIGHKGLMESLVLICEGLGWRPDRSEETMEPMIASRGLRTDFLEVAPGQVAGVHHTARAWRGERLLVELDLKMYVGAESSYDNVRILGEPPLDVTVQGGIAGDAATVAGLLNAVPLAVSASPGLLSPLASPLPRGFGA